MPAAVLVRELGLPRSTVYHLLATLVDNGFVTHLPEDRRYALGIAAYELGTGYTRQAPLQRSPGCRWPTSSTASGTPRTWPCSTAARSST